MQPTKLTYLEDFTILVAEAKVLESLRENDKDVVILDQTIFYPQGGGQPYDRGSINGSSGKFTVEEVRFVEGVVKHIGVFLSGAFKPGEKVQCIVDKERRELHSRLHSAGHVLDMAMAELRPDWVPGKGYHFPEGPYIEYAGSLGDSDRDALKAEVETLCKKFIAEDRVTKLVFMNKEKMKEVCRHVPEYLPEGKPARVVMFGDFGVPCGGTHVGHLGEIKEIRIRKIKQEGEKVKVGYGVG